MLVTIQKSSGQGWFASPNSEDRRLKFVQDARQNGAPRYFDGTLFLCSWEDVESTFASEIPPNKLKELSEGYTITVRMDDWTFRHMLGYCRD